MEWKRGALIAMVGLLLMAAFAESAAVHGGEVIQLVSDGVNDFPRKMMNGVQGCPRILMECELDSDCLPGCICRPNGFCG
ncbi:trypsin inhibitor 1-like [Cucurbita maxima]|uniref:Trypsin inhibitor 1-like n=1 Tax=Cucurbita maxima TaxID=3661 RepID=A0A6J1JBL8_CUCMA|nr:trypsin inhibitor 1-like [Cucurbita maxima]